MDDQKAYHTTSKEEVRRMSKTMEPEVWFRIWAISEGGSYFHIDVPEADLDKADKLLTDRAKQLDEI